MKVMLDILIRLLELRACCERIKDNPELTAGEKAAAYCMKRLVRECLPAPVLATYDRMEQSEVELIESREVFAMAVLVSTYRQASAAGQRKLISCFNTSSRLPDVRTTRSTALNRRGGK